MDFPVTTIVRLVISKLIALQSFFCARPRIDIDLINNPESLYGKNSLGPSRRQDHSEPIAISELVCDFEFYWNYKLRMKNNSSKTAYNLKIEKIFKEARDYLQKIDDIASLKEGEVIELDYELKHTASKSGCQAQQFLNHFPGHIEKIEILISYTNESRKKFYTKFIATKNSKINKHLLKRPK